MPTIAPSHRVTRTGDKITIHALELFVGFDPAIDDADDSKMKKYDAAKIAQVVERTQAHMNKGQTPKLIPVHNPDEDDPSLPPLPAIGDIVSLSVSPDNDLMIIGDVEVPLDVFETKIGNNAFPRRSAEIWSDGYMSEVTLLGATTPARPLPDTKFMREGLTRESFARDLPVVQFAQPVASMSEPGPTNVQIPGSPKMDDDHKDQLKAAHEEIDQLKAKLSKFMGHDGEDDEKDKDKNTRKGSKSQSSLRHMEMERDEFERQFDEQKRITDDLRASMLTERFRAEVKELCMKGYRIGNEKQRMEFVKDVVSAADGASDVEEATKACKARLSFLKQYVAKDPIGNRIDQSSARAALPGDQQEKFDRDKAAGERARDRCLAEGSSDPEKYKLYLAEELQKTG